MTETLSHLGDGAFNFVCGNAKLKESPSARKALLYALGEHEIIEKEDFTEVEYKQLDLVIDKICEQVYEEYGLKTNAWRTASDLCAFRNLIKGKRYVGFYIDRMLVDFQIMTENVGEKNLDPELFYNGRKRLFFEEYLGENIGLTETRTEIATHFKEQAILTDIVPLQERNLIDFDKELYP